MKKYILLLVLPIIFGAILCASSCSQKATSHKSASLWALSTKQQIRLSLEIPGKCNCILYAQEGARKKTYTYQDSSFIFLSDNETTGLFPSDALSKYGQNIFAMFTPAQDTIAIEGTDSKGRFWLIKRSGFVVYGYQMVSLANKPKFDSVLNSLKIQTFPLDYKTKPEIYEDMHLLGGTYEAKCKRF